MQAWLQRWPQTGVGLPNGLRRRKLWSSEIPFVGCSTKNRTTNALRMFLNKPSVESVPGEHTQLFTEGFPVIFHEGPFSSWNHICPCWFDVPISISEPNVCLRMAYGCLGVAWKDAWCPRAFIWCSDLMTSWHGMMILSYNILIWSCKIVIWSYNMVIWWYNIVLWPYNLRKFA